MGSEVIPDIQDIVAGLTIRHQSFNGRIPETETRVRSAQVLYFFANGATTILEIEQNDKNRKECKIMKKITLEMAKRMHNDDYDIMDEVVPIIMDAMKRVSTKLMISMPKELEDLDPQLMAYGLFVMVMLSNELSTDRKRKFVLMFFEHVVKEAMTPAAYKKYGAEVFGGDFWEGFPDLTNEEFDKLFEEK